MKSRQTNLPTELFRTAPSLGKIPSVHRRGELIDRQERKELLVQSRNGEVIELEVEFEAFSQQDGVSNKNFLRFKKSILSKLAKSFIGVPLLRDHSQNSVADRGGTVTASEAVKSDDGKVTFLMSAQVTAPWAVQAVLEGNLDRFSIGWDFPNRDSINCSACKGPAFSDGDFFPCHLPGDKLEDGEYAEFVFTDATGIEVSGVSVPAVAGTGISEIRAALSRAANAVIGPESKGENDMLRKQLIERLGLSEDATDESILAAQEAREAQAKAELSRAHEAGVLANEVAEGEKTLEALNKRIKEAEINALFAENANKFPRTRDENGKLCASPAELRLRELAARELDWVRSELAAMPEVHEAAPVGKTQTVSATALSGYSESAPAEGFTDSVAKACAQLGISKEQYQKFNPINGTETFSPFN